MYTLASGCVTQTFDLTETERTQRSNKIQIYPTVLRFDMKDFLKAERLGLFNNKLE